MTPAHCTLWQEKRHPGGMTPRSLCTTAQLLFFQMCPDTIHQILVVAATRCEGASPGCFVWVRKNVELPTLRARSRRSLFRVEFRGFSLQFRCFSLFWRTPSGWTFQGAGPPCALCARTSPVKYPGHHLPVSDAGSTGRASLHRSAITKPMTHMNDRCCRLGSCMQQQRCHCWERIPEFPVRNRQSLQWGGGPQFQTET